MLATILLNIAKYFIKKYAKEAIELGAETLAQSTDNRIDDELVDIFLDATVRSKGNGLTPNLKESVVRTIRKAPKVAYDTEGFIL